jgi:uncharacterized protein
MTTSATRRLKILSISVLILVMALSAWGTKRALHIPMTYSTEQFLPQGHELIKHDRENKKAFGVPIYSPQILVIKQTHATQSFVKNEELKKLQELTKTIEGFDEAEQVTSLGNIETAMEKNNDVEFGTVAELRALGLTRDQVLENPMLVPNLLSKDGKNAAIIVMPKKSDIKVQATLSAKMMRAARKAFPDAKVSLGGPAPIRSELLKLLSREILIFLALSLIAALIVLKLMFHGWSLVWQVLFMIASSNLISLGAISYLNFTYNMLSSTLSILVTVCCLGIVTRTLVRMGRLDKTENKQTALLHLMKELWLPHFLAAISTAVGFATLIPSEVPLISQYGLGVTVGALVGAFVTVILIPTFYLWMPWPRPRSWLGDRKGFAAFLIRHSWEINAGVLLTVIVFALIGTRLSWTARLFDDLPTNNSARSTTDYIGSKLGGSVSFDVRVILKNEKAPWKSPRNLAKLNAMAEKWRKRTDIGSVLTLSDLMMAGRKEMPKDPKALAEIQMLFGMSAKNPLPHFLSQDEKSTRISFRFPDHPADKMQTLTASLLAEVKRAYPGAEVQGGDLAAVVPKVNNELSRKLMWGFFDAMFWIILMLAIVFRSLRWALVAAIPNFVPPVMLLGFLAILHVPIKPGIAIIFSISLGLAFDNTVYILDRLKEIIKAGKTRRKLPIARVMAEETNPLLVSSLCLLVGFSIFLFSYFPVNKMFGMFMIISIGAGLLGDLVWLPCLLYRFPGLLLGSPKDAIVLERPRWMESAMKLSPYAILVVLGLVSAFGSRAEGTHSPDDILKQIEIRTSPPQETAHLQMTILEADGSKKDRSIAILRKNGKDQKALVRLEKPSDLKGLALLSVNSGEKEDQWLYLPSSKKTRRIVGNNQKGHFLDSEIAYEDLRPSSYKTFTSKITKESPTQVEIDSVAKKGSPSSYSRVHTTVSLPDYQVTKIEYWDEKGKLLKKTEFKGYQKVGDKFWRAKFMEVENLQNKRKTTLELKTVSLKKINDDDLSVSALEE